MEVSAEVHFAQTLAANEKKIRDRALKRLKKYIGVRSSNGAGMSHDDYIKIWKGLHYCMWMQDKPLIQEELSQKMTELLHAFPQLQQALKFVNVFFITEAREWTGLDKFRLDKFMMLMRDMLRETFVLLSREDWPMSECRMFAQNLAANVTNEDKFKIPYGVKMHLAEIFLAELRKVPLDGLNGKKLTYLMFPFIYFLLKTKRRELAQSMYEKTLHAAFKWFGTWPWNNGKTKNTKNNIDDEDESGDEEMDNTSDSEEETMEVEDNDDKKEKKRKHRFDLRIMLKLLLSLAKDPTVESRNRTYVYGIVNSYTSRDSSLLQGCGSGDENGDDGLDVSSVYQLTGEIEGKKRDKKLKKKKRQQFEKEEAEALVKKNNSENITKKKKQVSSDHQITSKKNKKKKENIDLKVEEQSVSEPVVKGKKRKRSSIEIPDEVTAKKLKTQEDENNSDNLRDETIKVNKVNSPKDGVNKSKKMKQKKTLDCESDKSQTPLQEVDKNDENCENSNTNALSLTSSPGRGKRNKISFSCPVKYVVYPQKGGNAKVGCSSQLSQDRYKFSAEGSPTRSKASVEKTGDIAVADLKPSTSPKTGNAGNKSSPRSAPAKIETDTSSEEKMGLFDTVYSAITTPGALIKKAVGMLAPSSKSGSCSKDKDCATAEQLTPGSQKKVVFDLKRNTANKFKDYLETLANDPYPAFEPNKSPGQGILKSPSSSSLNSADSNDSLTPTTTKRKGRRGSSKSPRTPTRKR